MTSSPVEVAEITPDGVASAVPGGDRSAKARQLLGMKGAQTGDTSIWKIRLQLMKPITWIPLMWGVICGASPSMWHCHA